MTTPEMLTESEAIKFLRLDAMKLKNPARTMSHWRMKGLLKGVRMSRSYVYRRADLDDFVTRMSSLDAKDLKPPSAAYGKRRVRRVVRP
jgi:hypothetical protein